jgi:peptide chain release factor 1
MAEVESDSELRELARDELRQLDEQRTTKEHELKILLLPKDPNDGKNAILEIRAGTGGDEAALFAGDLHRMYSRFAERQGWKVEMMSMSEGTAGGVKEVICLIEGKDVFSKLKFESGVHRVQRVPETEAQGRIHTSIVVACQDERSQIKNKSKAMKILRSRMLEAEREKQMQQEAAQRKSQVGSGDRSEKIRTYNFPQDRVTDHRIGLTKHNLPAIIDGNIDDIVEALRAHDQAEALKAQAGL